jgi:hypothetical protein
VCNHPAWVKGARSLARSTKQEITDEALMALRLESGRTVAEELAGLRRFARLLDNQFEVMGVRFGADAIVGLIPVAGDAVTLATGSAALYTSLRLKLPWHVHTRVVLNLLTDAGIGAIPILGDAFDFFFRSHKRNFRLVEHHVLERAAKQAGVRRVKQAI